jgi:hypothetical protein
MPRSSTHFREESSKNKGNRSKSNQLEHSIYQHIVWMGSHLPIALMSWYRFSLHGPQKVAVLGHGHQAEASTVPVGKRSTQGPTAPRPQGPKIPLGPASRPSSPPFRKITAVPQVPSGAVLTGEVKVLLDQRGSSSNGSKPWKQHQPASFWTQPATILHIYILCNRMCKMQNKRDIYIYNYNYIIIYIYIISQSNDPTRPLCMPERCLGLGPQRSSGLLK